MIEEIKKLVEEAMELIEKAQSLDELAAVDLEYSGKKGKLTALLKTLGLLAPDERKIVGQACNNAKNTVSESIDKKRSYFNDQAIARELDVPSFDPTLPSIPPGTTTGSYHPVSVVQASVERVFEQMGFKILDYYEAESDWFNFEGLNIPKDHPARDMQDTFWMKSGNLLRTHTSPGQLRSMKEFEPPFRAIFPGRVFRYERTDASHEHTFHQVEGIMIDKNLSVSNLIAIMKILLEAIFEREVTIRLRPGYFPFVEPGFELDIQCMTCGGGGCPVCKHSGWVELLPCGLIHPNVIRAGGLDPTQWNGWAFGLGLTRLAMMKYKINHITHFMSGDLRFLSQFKAGGAK
ncbi:phenylalanine--tRNA ligase subunit alpha [Myxococcota bacterium]|nr:phenylalanine--tRNA ligase subunit alpha [Myxococcota bacterium]MBU1381218.1 phenylalanine--tRNA ligase subunit alpha [Myxococcota bacterium]MBU1496271.1 phenylalanine--tRNA ligase subunit alpha [Myxococcota bacterium]